MSSSNESDRTSEGSSGSSCAVSSSGFSLTCDAWEHLVLTLGDGTKHAGVQVVRAFPLSAPDHSISILDAAGKELLYFDSLGDLPEPCRTLVREELSRREFLPVITRVVNDPPDSEPTEWVVETDRGRTTFVLESEDDVHRNDRNQVTIVDSNGIRYFIPDTRRLDRASRRVLDRFL